MAGIAGQGRRFSVPDALEAATLVFWKHGFEGASLKLLTGAMGINPPSFYKAFASKEELFFAVIDHYNATYGRFFADAFEQEATAAGLAQRILHGAADHYTNPDFPGGCLTLSATVNVTPENTHVAERLAALRSANISRIATALESDPARQKTTTAIPPSTVAAFIGATMQGMSQQARDGADADQLHAIADLALASTPIPPV